MSVVPGEVEIIPNTEEKYISFTKHISNIKCRFLDTFRFMSSSLAQLASNMELEKFKQIIKEFPKDKLQYVTRKGVFCYDYVTS